MTEDKYLEGVLREQTLAPGSPELKTLQQHRKEVESLLREEFGISPKIREGGSKAKHTMIKASYDLDLTCYFPHEEEEADKSLKEIYESVEAVLTQKYKTQRKGSAIRILDAEEETDFHVDVVPGRFVNGEDGDVFLYRSSGDKERLKTNLDVHIAHIRDSGVVDAIRLMKLWRERNAIKVKTFGLELLVIKLLKEKKKKKISEQLIHVWEEFRDNAEDLVVEDPANPNGNDLSELLNQPVKAQLSSGAALTLQTNERSGCEALFGKLQTDDEERTAALKRITIGAPAVAKPWRTGE